MLRRLAALVVVPAVLVAAGITAATAGDAGSFVAKANAERAARGLPRYAVRADLTSVALRHSARMADRGSLHHNPSLGSEVDGWEVVGENVGTGGSVDSIHAALMDSPSHRANILARDFTEVGVGTVTDDEGVIWVTQVFRRPVAAARTGAAPREIARTVVDVRVQRPLAVAPVRRALARRAPARPAAARAVDRPDPSAFLTALAPPGAAAGPFAAALAYSDTMGALNR